LPNKTKEGEAFRQAERAEDFRSTETDQNEAAPMQQDVAMEIEEYSTASQVRVDDARKMAKAGLL